MKIMTFVDQNNLVSLRARLISLTDKKVRELGGEADSETYGKHFLMGYFKKPLVSVDLMDEVSHLDVIKSISVRSDIGHKPGIYLAEVSTSDGWKVLAREAQFRIPTTGEIITVEFPVVFNATGHPYLGDDIEPHNIADCEPHEVLMFNSDYFGRPDHYKSAPEIPEMGVLNPCIALRFAPGEVFRPQTPSNTYPAEHRAG